MFNRGGFTTGYRPGLDDATLMYAERPNHPGVTVGECVRGAGCGRRGVSSATRWRCAARGTQIAP